ncbi:MAG: hypothetical protein K0R99_4608 [Microbacterium sp.]|jgi:hypothetical protein|nr:hypothetical protein [Microbacterium sp.]
MMIRHRIFRDEQSALMSPSEPALFAIDLDGGAVHRISLHGPETAHPNEDGEGFDPDLFPDGPTSRERTQ